MTPKNHVDWVQHPPWPRCWILGSKLTPFGCNLKDAWWTVAIPPWSRKKIPRMKPKDQCFRCYINACMEDMLCTVYIAQMNCNKIGQGTGAHIHAYPGPAEKCQSRTLSGVVRTGGGRSSWRLWTPTVPLDYTPTHVWICTTSSSPHFGVNVIMSVSSLWEFWGYSPGEQLDSVTLHICMIQILSSQGVSDTLWQCRLQPAAFKHAQTNSCTLAAW